MGLMLEAFAAVAIQFALPRARLAMVLMSRAFCARLKITMPAIGESMFLQPVCVRQGIARRGMNSGVTAARSGSRATLTGLGMQCLPTKVHGSLNNNR